MLQQLVDRALRCPPCIITNWSRAASASATRNSSPGAAQLCVLAAAALASWALFVQSFRPQCQMATNRTPLGRRAVLIMIIAVGTIVAALALTPSVAAAAAYPFTVVNCNLTFTYTQPPSRAVTLNQGATEVGMGGFGACMIIMHHGRSRRGRSRHLGAGSWRRGELPLGEPIQTEVSFLHSVYTPTLPRTPSCPVSNRPGTTSTRRACARACV